MRYTFSFKNLIIYVNREMIADNKYNSIDLFIEVRNWSIDQLKSVFFSASNSCWHQHDNYAISDCIDSYTMMENWENATVSVELCEKQMAF